MKENAGLNPGAPFGTMQASEVTFEAGSTFTVDIGAEADTLDVGDLDISGAALVINGTPVKKEYVLARYTTLSGEFTAVPELPEGYSLEYNHTDNGFTEIALVREGSEYELWAAANITDIDPDADASPDADPDGDGWSNLMEFALDSDPLSPLPSGKVVAKIAEIAGEPVFTLTLPVRSGAVFGGETEQVSDPIDELIYRIQGAGDLAAWTLEISEVPGAEAIQAGLPALNAGWSYRTFQCPEAVTDDPAAFMRIGVEME